MKALSQPLKDNSHMCYQKVCEDDMTEIAADLTTKLRSVREEINTNKFRMNELTQKRIDLTVCHKLTTTTTRIELNDFNIPTPHSSFYFL